MQDCETTNRKFVVGLGNPSRRYSKTRHNLGFMVLEALRRRWEVSGPRQAFGSEVWEARRVLPSGGCVLLLAPQTYMNRSGRAVQQMAAFYKASPEDILVVLDDLALPVGKLRARAGGSAGGHKGLADILQAMGNEQVQRLRIGIGSPPEPIDPTDFVLQAFRPEEIETIESSIQLAAEAVEDWVFNGIKYVMDKYNSDKDVGCDYSAAKEVDKTDE